MSVMLLTNGEMAHSFVEAVRLVNIKMLWHSLESAFKRNDPKGEGDAFVSCFHFLHSPVALSVELKVAFLFLTQLELET